ncbi:MAG: DNA polymerase Y family protein [Cypionkella sp.]|uniref:Y-family DNA polymerase n=1 Tax=Cypionkella sp. TaxID=2811411 RepID=UPI002AB854D0|nr:DNA polymerase Y family protein [Cypionkella sp.]MDZ4310854.1 DNA polymerase Y family protein [Cypionkella sp.]MDZ4394620.1 DNA polymerase Y family protein [Cypionkella sp.]
MIERRIVSIFLPQFPIERWQRQVAQQGNAPSDDLPQVLAIDGPHGPIIHACNRAARLLGVSEGTRVVDMRALCPSLRVNPADLQGDHAALTHLALWARRWCPWTAADGHGLILDTTGSDHLWGGEALMLEEIEARLSLLGFSVRLALASTWGAAWALARFGPVRAISRGPADLAPLPMAALRLGEETVLLLHRLGLKTVGDLAAVPRLALMRRFARAALIGNPLLRLDQMTGHLAEPLSPSDAPPVFHADVRLAEPIFDPSHHLPHLCEDLCARLDHAGRGARHLRLSVYRTDGEVSRIDVSMAAPSREAAHLVFLFRDRLERIIPGFGFDLISLEAPTTEALGGAQTNLAGGIDEMLELSHLVDRLVMRFGAPALSRPLTRASHIPERAEARAEPLAAIPDAPMPLTERPLRLLERAEEVRVLYAVPEGPPAQFIWRRVTCRTVRYAGPERIAPEWWQDKPGTRLRDYFKVEDDNGRRYWLYREGLHGDGRGGDPRWFLHGIFS